MRFLESSRSGYTVRRGVQRRSDGTFFAWAAVKAPPGTQMQFSASSPAPVEERLASIGQLRLLKAYSRGLDNPCVIVWDSYAPEIPWHWNYSRRDIPAAATLRLSRHSRIQGLLRELLLKEQIYAADGVLRTYPEAGPEAADVLKGLQEAGRVAVFSLDGPPTRGQLAAVDPWRDLVAAAPLGRPSQMAAAAGRDAVFNTGFFVFEEEDYSSVFSRLGDSYGLHVSGGVIQSLPLFARSAVLLDKEGRPQIRRLQLQDFCVTWGTKTWNLQHFAVNEASFHSVFNRRCGLDQQGRTANVTPERAGQLELIIIGRGVVGVRLGGGTEIPQNGWVLSIPEHEVPLDQPLHQPLYYAAADGSHWEEGLQAGPVLIDRGLLQVDETLLQREEFQRRHLESRDPHWFGVLPTDYAADVDRTRAARTAVAWDEKGCWLVLAVEGVNQGAAEIGDSSGCSLLELAELLQAQGAWSAVNMDGGGSTNLQYRGGFLIKPADRRGMPGHIYERMVPQVGILSQIRMSS